MSKQPSAKDKAFEKERIKYRRQIKELEHKVAEQEKHLQALELSLSEMDTKLQAAKSEVQRLLEVSGMNRDELKLLLEDKKQSAELRERMTALCHMSSFLCK